MNQSRFVIKSLTYHWRTNLAVLLGVIAATAVIGGALIVGDSVRASLRQMTLDRLGKIDYVVSGHRFFREQLADDLQHSSELPQDIKTVAPALVLRGSLEKNREDQHLRVGQVNIFGTDQRLWSLLEHSDLPPPEEDQAILNSRVAEQLEAKVGDEITLWIELPSAIPRDSLLGEKEEQSVEITLTVSQILDEDSKAGRLALLPNQQLPLDLFLSLDTLQAALDLDEIKPSRRDPKERPARVNSLFFSSHDEAIPDSPQARIIANELEAALKQDLKLTDLNLKIVPNKDRNYLSLESEQMILDPQIERAARDAAKKLKVATSPVMVYIANEFIHPEPGQAKQSPPYSMYSIVAGLDFAEQPPFGPFKFIGDKPQLPLKENEIVLNEWLAKDLKVKIGDPIQMKYHVVGSRGELPEVEQTFTVAGIVALDGTPAADRKLTPEMEGITDADTFGDWKQPFPMKLDKVTDRDEEYWDKYRATPKAFLALETAQKLWNSRYGTLTSLRFASLPGKTLEESSSAFGSELLKNIDVLKMGLTVQPIKFLGLAAASGTTDFSGLFIGFSFFIILSAIILIRLLFKLGIDRRVSSIGLLSAIGFTPAQVRQIIFKESLIVILSGGVLGILAAIGYASLMLYGLKTWWIGAIGTRFLFVDLTPQSLLIGFLIAVLFSGFVIWKSMSELKQISIRDLLSGVNTPETEPVRARKRVGLTWKISTILAFILVLATITGIIPKQEAFSGFSWQTVCFFLVGTLSLVASLSFLSSFLRTDSTTPIQGKGALALMKLGFRNAGRFRQRSVLTTALIASATFVLVSVAAGHRNPAVEEPDIESGNGGFTLVAETSSPLIFDLDTPEGRDKMLVNAPNDPETQRLLTEMKAIPFRVKPGENASCLNIYQTTVPTILGVPQELIERGGFKFADTPGDNPWELLNQPQEDGSIPALGDMNTLMYSLHKGIGASVGIPSDERPKHKLKIKGMFDGSIFQGVLLISEQHFQQLFPEQAGFQYFLIEVPTKDATELSSILETGLTEYGFDSDLVSNRLADFLAVQNTYLSTFQTLGGLGLLLGTLGLATVMLRNVVERRSELALLRAVGMTGSNVALIVLAENAFLLVWGLASGIVSALLAMLPHLLSTGADIPWLSGILILLAVLITGMLSAFLAVLSAVRAPILATLRAP
ncbi:FtsX-like permease family protein [Gimesia panareensis]|uniref:FtsX-like permease family protein n=1 Tax=Gimesia panareensis TaxID=2527978 RepID=A0A518FXJ3_9PLAN|nr:FtsX-like permease family protein [Gimesia panareensis]QDV21098.1 FtsX-like permease family protein [Gimesia panareensis]